MSEKYTLSCLVENHFGVLVRIAGLISARGFNIDSLTVSTTEDPTISRMTIVVDADAVKLEQVKHQLGRLIDVIEVQQLTEGNFIDRELLLARVKANGKSEAELAQIAERYGAKLAHASSHAVVIEAIGDTKAMDRLVEQLRPLGITQLVRTGRIALEKQ
ncbi:MAG: acetolactate synthase small subunit [Candidatus Omnitrophica bacterium]|nr:acetolactate synthase small subunit [Candidatus Omnitrophota bacterium]MBI2174511.1 acetolactate synthase small subunit [Candidatus Omnitrophota bacterium]MBI3010533.1 acetolactate synthase small subunit [Candidatus Omnitrophota bacterium]